MNKLASPRPPCPSAPRPSRLGLAALALAWPLGLQAALPVDASGLPAALPESLAADVRQLVKAAATVVLGHIEPPPRIEVQVGRPDARLRLAACSRITPYLPAGTRPMGRTRIGLRCAQGPVPWNISLPLTVKVLSTGLVAAGPLPAGTVLTAAHLQTGEVDLAERADPVLRQPSAAVGRTLAQGLAAGDALRRDDLKQRLWFAAGDTVRVMAVGPGYAVSGEGQALGPGVDGQAIRVRTEGGRVITGVAVGERRVEVPL